MGVEHSVWKLSICSVVERVKNRCKRGNTWKENVLLRFYFFIWNLVNTAKACSPFLSVFLNHLWKLRSCFMGSWQCVIGYLKKLRLLCCLNLHVPLCCRFCTLCWKWMASLSIIIFHPRLCGTSSMDWRWIPRSSSHPI